MSKANKHIVPASKKQAIVAEYINTGTTLRNLQDKHGYDFRTIGAWVNEYRKKAGAAVESISPRMPQVKAVAHPQRRSRALVHDLVNLFEEHGVNATISVVKGNVTSIKID